MKYVKHLEGSPLAPSFEMPSNGVHFMVGEVMQFEDHEADRLVSVWPTCFEIVQSLSSAAAEPEVDRAMKAPAKKAAKKAPAKKAATKKPATKRAKK